jgi:hypothetical protein
MEVAPMRVSTPAPRPSERSAPVHTRVMEPQKVIPFDADDLEGF